MIRQSLLFTALLATGLACATSAQAAEIKIINEDVGTGLGLDDATPAAPIGDNPGTTRGEQALIVFQFAADLWGAVLQSDVAVLNSASFQPLSCNATSGVLGSSGTNYIFSFNPGGTLPAGAIADTWYHSALADALAGLDNNDQPGTPDIISQFNGKLGQTGCLEGSGWYFGLDGNTPVGQINFLDVVIHEMAHGLGFSGFNSLSSGTMFQGTPDIYSHFVKDNSTNELWIDMTDAERVTASLNDGHLIFTGTQVTNQAPLALEASINFQVSAPANIAGSYDYRAASFGPAPTPANFSGTAVAPTSDSLACNVSGQAAPVQGVSGNIALIDRGTCAFTEKTANAQAGGATGVIIVNNVEEVIIPAGDDPSITIPVIAVLQSVGNSFKANTPVTLSLQQGQGMAGTDAQGYVQLYAPTTLNQGSSFSHYDTRLTPNAIMEYASTSSTEGNLDLDLTPALFSDIGWGVNVSDQYLLDCNTGVPTSMPGGVIVGANIFGYARALAAKAPDVDAYRQAIRDHATVLANDGLLTQAQVNSLNLCLDDTQTQAQYDAWHSDAGGGGGGGDAIPLTNRVALTGQSGAAGTTKVYSIDVPQGARMVSLRSYGGTGDVSLYVKFGTAGSSSDYDGKSTRRGNSESVTLRRPQAGTYYLTVEAGPNDFSGLNVQVSVR